MKVEFRIFFTVKTEDELHKLEEEICNVIDDQEEWSVELVGEEK